MKLRGHKNDTHVVASIAHYDCQTFGEGDQFILHDGGQPGCFDYPGYNRSSGECVLFEVPQTHEELYNDYQFNRPRQYGCWKLGDVKILIPEEFPDTNTWEYRHEHILWGTRGKNGDEPLKYVALKNCSIEHLQAILDTQNPGSRVREACQYWISGKTGH